ncbi:MAG TPA: hypothetical protein VKF62_06815 [Planctomycetota bacterium]|nr:hypothetical protein [Planctomycetota bacterium]
MQQPRNSMGTLYLRNVSPALLQKLRVRARVERRSVAQEAVRLLEEAVDSVGGPDVRFRALLDKMRRYQESAPSRRPRRPSTEELVREDRDR